jgi:hypothetical protein
MNSYIGENQLWTVKIQKISNTTVLVTTSVQKLIRNKGKAERKKSGLYSIKELRFDEGPAKILECSIEDDEHKKDEFKTRIIDENIVAETAELAIKPNATATFWGKAEQYRRISDVAFEVFMTPAVNPQIEVVLVPEGDFGHKIEFGTEGKVTKEKNSNRYALSGVYFPGQYMFVQWWPKNPATTVQ